MSEHQPDELRGLEAALRELQPAGAVGARDRILFEAGRAAAPRPWIWPASTAALGVLVAFLGVMLWQRPQPLQVIVQLTPLPTPLESSPSLDPNAPVAHEPGAAPSAYLSQRTAVLTQGVDALPPATPLDVSTAPPLSANLHDAGMLP